MSVKPTEILMGEHRVIEQVMAALRRYAAALEAGQAVDDSGFGGLVPFMREFADARHHGKEEFRLFPLLVERGLPASNGPVQVMCSEHDVGRRLVGELEAALAAYAADRGGAAAPLAGAMKGLAEFYTQHIWKEDNILFHMADRVLDEDSASRLLAAFGEVDGPDAAEIRDRYSRFAASLA